MRILFIHGGGYGAYAVDRDLVSALSDALVNAVDIEYPHVRGLEQIDWKTTEPQLRVLLEDAAQDSILVAHSIGASAILKLLAGGTSTRITGVFLLAPPYKAADSHWGVDEFTFPNGFATRIPQNVAIAVYHCEDDTIIPAADAIDYQRTMPSAKISLLPAGGHQFVGSLDGIARDICAVTER